MLPRSCGIPQAREIFPRSCGTRLRVNFGLGRRDGFEPAHQAYYVHR